jgi:hypothetical protein
MRKDQKVPGEAGISSPRNYNFPHKLILLFKAEKLVVFSGKNTITSSMVIRSGSRLKQQGETYVYFSESCLCVDENGVLLGSRSRSKSEMLLCFCYDYGSFVFGQTGLFSLSTSAPLAFLQPKYNRKAKYLAKSQKS